MLGFLKNQDGTYNKANILPAIGFTIGLVAGAAAFNPAFLGSLGTTLVLSGFTPALFGVVAAFLIIGSLCRIHINRQIEVAKQEAKAAENNSVLGVLTNNIQKELKKATISEEGGKLHLILSGDDYKALTTSKSPGDVIALHAFINGGDVEVKFNHAAPAVAPSDATPAKVELVSVGSQTVLDEMKKALGMNDNQPLNVEVSNKTLEVLKSELKTNVTDMLAEQVATKVFGAPAGR